MSHSRVPCACCFNNIVRDPKQKKTHYFIGCGCPVSPLVCAQCRRGTFSHTPTICGWCQKRGLCTSFNFASHASDIRNAARDWIDAQKRFSNVSIPYIMQIRLNWLKYHEFVKIKFYEIRNNFLFYRYNFLFFREYREDFAIPFFSSFMQSQMFHITGSQKISIQYHKFGVSQKLFWLVKNVTVARMLICNLFCESKNTRFFTGRRQIIKSNQELMSIVFHRLLSNFALLIR
jgi:hypothetical protein